jgi:hypothetical protein
MPHHDIESRDFEIGSGLACVCALAVRFGLLSPVTIGAVAASAPDIEHVLPGADERKQLFPSHRIPGWHREGGVPVWAQLLAAGTILGFVLARAE